MTKKKKAVDFDDVKDMIFDFMAQHKGIIYEPKDLQLAMIAHKYPVHTKAGVTPALFIRAVDTLIEEGKITLYVRLA